MTGKIVVMLLFSFLMIAAGLFTVHPEEGGGLWVHIALIGVGSLFNMMAVALMVAELELLGKNGLGLAALEKISRLEELEDKINRMEEELESLRSYVDGDNWLKD